MRFFAAYGDCKLEGGGVRQSEESSFFIAKVWLEKRPFNKQYVADEEL